MPAVAIPNDTEVAGLVISEEYAPVGLRGIASVQIPKDVAVGKAGGSAGEASAVRGVGAKLAASDGVGAVH